MTYTAVTQMPALHWRAVPPSSTGLFFKITPSSSSSLCSHSTITPSYPMGCCFSEIKNNPFCVANHRCLVVVVTSAEVPGNNSQVFVSGLLLLCCWSLCPLFNGKVDNQVQMLFVKAFAANWHMFVCV